MYELTEAVALLQSSKQIYINFRKSIQQQYNTNCHTHIKQQMS